MFEFCEKRRIIRFIMYLHILSLRYFKLSLNYFLNIQIFLYFSSIVCTNLCNCYNWFNIQIKLLSRLETNFTNLFSKIRENFWQIMSTMGIYHKHIIVYMLYNTDKCIIITWFNNSFTDWYNYVYIFKWIMLCKYVMLCNQMWRCVLFKPK